MDYRIAYFQLGIPFPINQFCHLYGAHQHRTNVSLPNSKCNLHDMYLICIKIIEALVREAQLEH